MAFQFQERRLARTPGVAHLERSAERKMKTWPHRILTIIIVGGTLTVWSIGLYRNIPSYDGSLDTIIGVSNLPTKAKHVLTLIILGAGLCIFPFIAVKAFREAFGVEKKEADPDRQRTTRGM